MSIYVVEVQSWRMFKWNVVIKNMWVWATSPLPSRYLFLSVPFWRKYDCSIRQQNPILYVDKFLSVSSISLILQCCGCCCCCPAQNHIFYLAAEEGPLHGAPDHDGIACHAIPWYLGNCNYAGICIFSAI